MGSARVVVCVLSRRRDAATVPWKQEPWGAGKATPTKKRCTTFHPTVYLVSPRREKRVRRLCGTARPPRCKTPYRQRTPPGSNKSSVKRAPPSSDAGSLLVPRGRVSCLLSFSGGGEEPPPPPPPRLAFRHRISRRRHVLLRWLPAVSLGLRWSPAPQRLWNPEGSTGNRGTGS